MIRHLLNTGEVARVLGVTPARVTQLSGTRADFPAPYAYTLLGERGMNLWRPADIERWRDTADRSPGRPMIERNTDGKRTDTTA